MDRETKPSRLRYGGFLLGFILTLTEGLWTNLVLKENIHMFQKMRKRFAVKKILHKLPTALVKRYGLSEKYTQGQIKKTMEIEGFNQDYLHYAYAVILDFDAAVACLGNEEMVLSIRSEVIQQYLGGEENLKVLFEKAKKVGNSSVDYGHYGDNF